MTGGTIIDVMFSNGDELVVTSEGKRMRRADGTFRMQDMRHLGPLVKAWLAIRLEACIQCREDGGHPRGLTNRYSILASIMPGYFTDDELAMIRDPEFLGTCPDLDTEIREIRCILRGTVGTLWYDRNQENTREATS